MELRTRSAWIAVGVAPLAAVQVPLRELFDKAWWPFLIDDVLVAAFLGVSAWLVIRESTSTRARMLSCAWGAMLLVLWSAVFRHLRNGLPGPEVYNPYPGLVTAFLGLLFAMSILGLVWSLPTSRKPFIGTRPPKE